MFCNQCEQTANGVACTGIGVCGKQPHTAVAQDIIVYTLRGLARVALEARRKGIVDDEVDMYSVKALCATLTNVNFDTTVLLDMARKVCEYRDFLAKQTGIERTTKLTTFVPPLEIPHTLPQAISIEFPADNADIRSLKQILLYGFKGVAAYADQAAILGKTDQALFSSIYNGLTAGFDNTAHSIDDWLRMIMNCGKANIQAMELLDTAHTKAFGAPEPTRVRLGPVEGKAILVSGHDLKDLYSLLVQTREMGINIYTHGEMLSAHAYHGLKKFRHLAGHFGSAWQNQQKELAAFPGAVLFTTNCIQRPLPSYAENVFTTGVVGWPGIRHVHNDDFTAVIDRARKLPGFSAQEERTGNPVRVLTGFAHNTTLNHAKVVIKGMRHGAIRHFFLVGGCDGAKTGRNYYTEFVEKTPPDTIILTFACGKFRFFDKPLGTIRGIPRLLDVGQCNDAYSAIKIALTLAEVFERDINQLPLSFILSWYEQKAIAVLLSLLALGVKNIRLGPSMPAFISPNILNFLVEQFAIKPVTTPGEDLKSILG